MNKGIRFAFIMMGIITLIDLIITLVVRKIFKQYNLKSVTVSDLVNLLDYKYFAIFIVELLALVFLYVLLRKIKGLSRSRKIVLLSIVFLYAFLLQRFIL